MRYARPSRWGTAFALVLTAVMFLGVLAPAARAENRRHEMLGLINEERKERGIHKLRLDRDLSSYARKHSKQMEDADKLFHSDKLSRHLPRSWSTWGENVGVGLRVGGLHRAFMRSDAHRSNVLYRSFRQVGIGYARSPDGILWVTIVFYG